VSKTIGGVTTNYLYDGMNPVQELYGGSSTASLLTGLAIDEYFQRTDANGPANFLTDALGSTIALTGPAGNTVAQYTYDPYGNTTMTGSSTNPYQFTGRENDSTMLYYYRARYYIPQIQRFMSEDPADFRTGANVYEYVVNRPTDGSDPLGLWSRPAHDKILTHSLSGCASPSDIEALQAASRDFDYRTGRSVGFAPLHSMRAPYQTPQQAISIRDSFIQQTLSQASAAQQAGLHGAALSLLAEALHPVMDSTSLVHMANGEPLVWGDFSPSTFLNDIFHSPGDWWGDETSDMLAFGFPRFNAIEREIRSDFIKVMGGCSAGRK
jgi:RHS repeat-associated protein